MKRWISVLAVLIALLMLTLPTSANTIEKLQEIYNNLSAYMYEPYFEKSESFTEYKEAFGELKAFLKEDTTPTQKEISHHYQRMKAAFSALMLETFDYSELVAQAETYQTMDSFLFTSVSWEKLVSAADTIIRELDSPMLFTRNPNTSFDEYSAVVQNHIRSLSNAFTDAYNELEMVLPEINVTKQQLGALAKHAENTAHFESFFASSFWEEYEICLDEAKTVAELRNPRQTRIDAAAADLLVAYKNLMDDCTDQKPVTEALAQYNLLNADKYTAESWARYEENALALLERMKKPYFFYLPKKAPTNTVNYFAERFFVKAAAYTNTDYKLLVTTESFEALQALCLRYQNISCSEGLEVKRNRLLTCVADAREVMKNVYVTPAQISAAGEAILTAANDLELSERFLQAEKDQVVRQDASTIQKIVILTTLSLVLSLGFACVTSYRFFGRLNWRK